MPTPGTGDARHGFFHAGRAVTRQRLYCPFVIEAGSRYLHIPGITANPDGPRTGPQNRNLPIDGSG